MNTRRIGSKYEKKTVEYMLQNGMQVLETNYRCKQGEIDIIGKEEDYLLFVEVKYRKSVRSGYPAEAVTPAKQNRVIQTARYYLYSHNLSEYTKMRFDVAAILGEELQYIRNVF
ncbi:MAG: YraN family protein [Lachnospiraceae bacterium]|nr:YraN family protein [Lachnospiraceae bacterium]